MKNSKWLRILYWVVTVILLLPLAGSGVLEALGHPSQPVAQTLQLLGYPLYLARITGTAKLLGALFILLGRFPRVKEWAYAGYSCLFLGATASHLLAGDSAHALYPFIAFVLLMVSYGLWRMVGSQERTKQ